jgi:hypothetical protein
LSEIFEKDEGVRVSRKRIARLMKASALAGAGGRKSTGDDATRPVGVSCPD